MPWASLLFFKKRKARWDPQHLGSLQGDQDSTSSAPCPSPILAARPNCWVRLEVGGLGWAGLHDYQPVRSDEGGAVAPTCDPSTRGLGLDSGKEGLQVLVYDGSGLDWTYKVRSCLERSRGGGEKKRR